MVMPDDNAYYYYYYYYYYYHQWLGHSHYWDDCRRHGRMASTISACVVAVIYPRHSNISKNIHNNDDDDYTWFHAADQGQQ